MHWPNSDLHNDVTLEEARPSVTLAGRDSRDAPARCRQRPSGVPRMAARRSWNERMPRMPRPFSTFLFLFPNNQSGEVSGRSRELLERPPKNRFLGNNAIVPIVFVFPFMMEFFQMRSDHGDSIPAMASMKSANY